MDETLLGEVLGRLDADASASDEVKDLVLAVLLDDLQSFLDGETPERPDVRQEAPDDPARAYVRTIAVEGFRGVGARAELNLPTGPGLTLVVGRNGSGKSSFAEAFEYSLTGDNRRWSQRKSKAWSRGWRNLHHDDRALIEAELLIDGEQHPATIQCSWNKGAELEDGQTILQKHGTKEDPATLGWSESLTSCRPFLSYNELGGMLEEGPAKLFDALAAILGLEDLSTAEKRLAEKRREITAEEKQVKKQRDELCAAAERLDDERAAAFLEAVRRKPWKLQRVSQIVEKDRAGAPEEASIRTLRGLAALGAPVVEEAGRAVADLRAAVTQVERTSGTDAARARRLAAVLQKALELHQNHGDDDCPVCKSPSKLDDSWAEGAKEEIDTLLEQAREATEAHERLAAAEKRARALTTSPTGDLDRAAEVDIDIGPLRVARQTLRDLSSDDRAQLIDRLEDAVLAAATETETVRAAARVELERREDAWRPVSERIHSWLAEAERTQVQSDLVKELRTAEKWIKETTGAIRDERFAPIADSVKRFWEILRADSSVEIDDVALTGSATRRHVNVDVTVDGTPGVALGVMSQGELHALALSLFLPRATLDSSPFGFVVIDDPVQAMDPARVDGLAQVLHSVGEQRQVVVFTHDDRLPEAVRRLRIPATVIEVQRRAHSVVELRRRKGPVEDAIDDALALAHTDDLPADAAARVIPGLCRQALEAACMEVIRRRRLSRGQPHAEVEALLVDHSRLNERLALALRDAAEYEHEVMGSLKNKYGPWAADVVGDCNRGSHGESLADPAHFVRGAEKLAKGLLELS